MNRDTPNGYDTSIYTAHATNTYTSPSLPPALDFRRSSHRQLPPDARDYSHLSTRIAINPFLQSPNIVYDFHYHPSTIITFLERRPLSPEERSQPAIRPTVPYVWIKCHPWPHQIVVRPRVQGDVVTIDDILTALHDYCQQTATFADLDTLSASERAQATATHNHRIAAIPDLEAQTRAMMDGMKMIDFLMGRSSFVGLSMSDESQYILVLQTTHPF